MGDEKVKRPRKRLSEFYLQEVNYPDPKFCSKTSLIQLGCGIWINLGSLSVGLIYGFSAVAIPQMIHPEQYEYQNITINITESDEGWITSLSVLVAPIGTLICGYILDHFGRQVGMVLSIIPLIIGWLCLSLATDLKLLLIGRVINGIGIGMMKLIPTIYTSEITLPNMRGVTGVIPQLAQSIGITIQAGLGLSLHWHHLCYMSLSFNLLLLVANSLLPETPYYKLMKGTEASALKSLKQFRGSGYDVHLEMKEMVEFKINNDIRRLTFREKYKVICSKVVCKPLFIVLIYIMIAEMSGISIIYYYGVNIMEHANISINPFMGHIILSSVRICCNIVGAVCVFKYKRKTLSVVSAIGVGSSLLSLGIFIHIYKSPSILPIFFGASFILFSAVGFMPLPPIIMAEYCPLQIRGTVNSFLLMLKYLLTFAANRLYPLARETISFENTVNVMGLISLFGSIFLYFFIPNTKDLTLSEIEEFLKKKKPDLKSTREIKRTQYNASLSQLNIDKMGSYSLVSSIGKNISKDEYQSSKETGSSTKPPPLKLLSSERTADPRSTKPKDSNSGDELELSKLDAETSNRSYDSDKKRKVQLNSESEEIGTTSNEKKDKVRKSSMKKTKTNVDGEKIKDPETEENEDQKEKERKKDDK